MVIRSPRGVYKCAILEKNGRGGVRKYRILEKNGKGGVLKCAILENNGRGGVLKYPISEKNRRGGGAFLTCHLHEHPGGKGGQEAGEIDTITFSMSSISFPH